MICIIDTIEENKKQIEQLARKMVGDDRLFDSSPVLADQYKRIVHNFLSLNDGRGFEYNPDGSESEMWKELLKKYNNNESLAIRDRLLVYTDQYIAEHGMWYNEYEGAQIKHEPTLLELEESAYYDSIKNMFTLAPGATFSDDFLVGMKNSLNRKLITDVFNNVAIGNNSKLLSVPLYELQNLYLQDPDTQQLIEQDADMTAQILILSMNTAVTQEKADRIKNVTRLFATIQKTQEWNELQIYSIVDKLKNSLAKLFGLRLGLDGMVDISDALDINGQIKEDRYADVARAMMINTMMSRLIDPKHRKFAMIVLLQDPTTVDPTAFSKAVIEEYISIFDEVFDLRSFLRDHGIPVKNDKLYIKFKKQFIDVVREKNSITGKLKDGKMHKIFSSLFYGFYGLLSFLYNSLGFTGRFALIGTTLGTLASLLFAPSALLTCSLVSGIASITVGKIIQKYTKAEEFQPIVSPASLQQEMQNLADVFIVHASLCNDIDRCGTLKFIHAQQLTKNELKYAAIEELRRNINLRILSLRASENISSGGLSGAIQLEKMLDDINQLQLMTTSENKETVIDQVVERYITEASESINKLITWVSDNKSNMTSIDPSRLMYIKNDVIGAYDDILNNVLNTYNERISKSLTPDKNNRLYVSLLNAITSLNVLKNEFSTMSRQYLANWINTYMDDSFGNTLPSRMNQLSPKLELDVIKENIVDLLSNVFVDSSIPVLDLTVLPARVSTSPLVRLVHDSLSQVAHLAHMESLYLVSTLENIRSKARKSGNIKLIIRNNLAAIGPYNMMNILVERDANGQLGDNIVSDINKAKYDSERRDFFEKCFKELGIVVDAETGDLIYPSTPEDPDGDEAWKKFHIKLFQWEAEEDAFGNKRIHRRFNQEYYIKRIEILGRRAYEELTSVDSLINELRNKLTETFDYVDKKGNKREVKIPMTADLSPDDRNLLWALLLKKRTLSSPFIPVIEDGKIKGFEDKSPELLEIAEKIREWNEYKSQFYEGLTPDFSMYDLVKQQLEDKISELESDLAHAKSVDEIRDLNEKIGKARTRLAIFINDNTGVKVNPELRRHLTTTRKLIQDISEDGFTGSRLLNLRRLKSLLNKRSSIMQMIKVNNEKGSRNLDKIHPEGWASLRNLDLEISDLTALLDINQQDERPQDQLLPTVDFLDMYEQQDVKKLNNQLQETGQSYYEYLQSLPGFLEYNYTYFNGSTAKLLKILELWVPNEDFINSKLDELSLLLRKIYIQEPIGIFEGLESIALDPKYEEFSDTGQDIAQIDKNRYNNDKLISEIKKYGLEEVRQELIKLMNYGWDCYAGHKRPWKYKLPQKEAALGSLMLRKGRFLHAFSSILDRITKFNTRQADEINESYQVRPDGSVVEEMFARWTKDIEDPRDVDTDLVSTVGDFVHEALKYKYRMKLLPTLEMMKFEAFGGYTKAADAGSTDQARAIQAELSRGLYGRQTIGSGINGRFRPGEATYAKLSKTARSVLHLRLMGNNPLSLGKNAADSTSNIFGEMFRGKYIHPISFFKSLGKFITGCYALPGLWTYARSSVATLNEGLLALNELSHSIHDRFEGQNKYYLRRVANKSASALFEAVDYSAKSFLLDCVYDSYRLMYNKKTGQYEFLNNEEAERIYEAYGMSAKEGWEAWKRSSTTLKDVYRMDKKSGMPVLKEFIKHSDGGHVMKFNVIDLVRPKKQFSIRDDKRSIVLETKVRNTLHQLAQTVNGMLEDEDKNTLERHYLGALMFAFRGWMVSQYGEFTKEGQDFWKKVENTNDIREAIRLMNLMVKDTHIISKEPPLNKRYLGQLNIGTGHTEQGVFNSMWKTAFKNLDYFVANFLILGRLIDKYKYLDSATGGTGRVSPGELDSIRKAATSLHLMMFVITACVYALKWWDDDDENGMKALNYNIWLASITERLPTLGKYAFLWNSKDMLKAVTVGNTLLDDAGSWFGLIRGVFDEEYRNTVRDKTDDAFYGKTQWQKDITYSLADFGIDVMFPALVGDAVQGNNPLSTDGSSFTDYSLNWFKHKTPQGAKANAKYQKTVDPIPLVNWGVKATGWNQSGILPPKKPKEKSERDKFDVSGKIDKAFDRIDNINF